jgi:hypothetical protein
LDPIHQIIEAHNQSNQSAPLWLHLAFQNVHDPYTTPPEWECETQWPGIPTDTWPTTDYTYG